jgi:hypothetical protein
MRRNALKLPKSKCVSVPNSIASLCVAHVVAERSHGFVQRWQAAREHSTLREIPGRREQTGQCLLSSTPFELTSAETWPATLHFQLRRNPRTRHWRAGAEVFRDLNLRVVILGNTPGEGVRVAGLASGCNLPPSPAARRGTGHSGQDARATRLLTDNCSLLTP